MHMRLQVRLALISVARFDLFLPSNSSSSSVASERAWSLATASLYLGPGSGHCPDRDAWETEASSDEYGRLPRSTGESHGGGGGGRSLLRRAQLRSAVTQL